MVRLHLDSGAIMRYANFRKVESLVEAFFIGGYMITQERLKELLDYNEVTGIFTWKIQSANRISVGDIAGCLDGRGYRRIAIDGRKYREHRLAWLYVYGKFPPAMLDHIDRDKINNRINNLRAVTSAQNGQNRNTQHNSSGYRGVTWNLATKKWTARVRHNGKIYEAGLFKNLDDAVVAVKALRSKLFTHYVEF